MRVENGPSTIYDTLVADYFGPCLVIFRLPPSDIRPLAHKVISIIFFTYTKCTPKAKIDEGYCFAISLLSKYRRDWSNIYRPFICLSKS